MPELPRLLRPAEVAAALGVPPASFQWALGRLRRERGFPHPVLLDRYDPEAITAWFARQRIEALPFPPATRGDQGEGKGALPPDDITAWQVELDRRLAGLVRDNRAA